MIRSREGTRQGRFAARVRVAGRVRWSSRFWTRVRVGVTSAVTVLSLVLAFAPVSSASPPGAALWLLDVTPEVSTAATGTTYTLTASVTDVLGNGQAGAMIDFEVLSGPGDDDIGTSGNTPTTPDMSCVTSGGGLGVPATCTVAYIETDNVAGDDPILAWIDVDGLDERSRPMSPKGSMPLVSDWRAVASPQPAPASCSSLTTPTAWFGPGRSAPALRSMSSRRSRPERQASP